MSVITFANPKGGSGKTTAALLLAEQLGLAGARVAILDLDPGASILSWAHAHHEQGRDALFVVHGRPKDSETVERMDVLNQEADYLIVDLEGARDQMVTYALSRTDLCLVPLDGSPLEARQAAHTVQLIRTVAQMIRTPIRFALLFTRLNAAFQSADERDVRREMAENGIPVLSAGLVRRAPYTRIFRDGQLLSEMSGDIDREKQGRAALERRRRQLASAMANAQEYAGAVAACLSEERAA